MSKLTPEEKAYNVYYRTLGRIESERRLKERMAATALEVALKTARKEAKR